MRAFTLGLALLVSLPSVAGERFKGGVFDPPRDAPDFTLKGSNGAPAKISDFRGKVVALAFGFTYCQKVCPVTLGKLAQVFGKLGKSGDDLQVMFVSVDPDRDSPERMKEFLAFFGTRFLGATGEAKELQVVRDTYGIVADKAVSEDKRLGYEVHHSSSVYVIDKKGKLRLLLPFGRPVEEMRHDLEILLKE